MRKINSSYFILLCCITIFCVIACKTNPKEDATINIDIKDASDSASIVTDTIIDIPNPNILTADSTQFCYLISGYFEDQDTIRKEFPSIKKRKWDVLTYVVDKRKFQLKPVELDTLYWHDECNGVDMLTVINLERKRQIQDEFSEDKPNEIDYIYISRLNHLSNDIPSHFHTQISVIPGSPYSFDFNHQKYTLRAEGDYSQDDTTNAITKNYIGRLENYVDGYNSYKLYLESEGIVQLLNSDSYSSTCLEILFIGDLDGDGKPDFLFETNSWYEGSEVTLFLSSKANKGELVKNMGKSGNYYSC